MAIIVATAKITPIVTPTMAAVEKVGPPFPPSTVVAVLVGTPANDDGSIAGDEAVYTDEVAADPAAPAVGDTDDVVDEGTTVVGKGVSVVSKDASVENGAVGVVVDVTKLDDTCC